VWLASSLVAGACIAMSGCGDDDSLDPPIDAASSVDAGDATVSPADLGPPDLTGCSDSDGDGHRSSTCGGDDCDDSDPSRYPGATEECDDDDEDCNDATYGVDADADGFQSSLCCNGADNCGPDCDDALSTVSPTASEVCNAGVDDDCDGLADSADGVCVPCAPGFTGMDGACADVDECATTGFCGVGAVACTNVTGTFVCTCATGYAPGAPTGGLCANVNECAASVDPCGGGSCVDNAGSYVCTCPAGYRLAMTPVVTCVDVDECGERTDMCMDAPLVAVCANTSGDYACMCPAGYSGSGRGAAGCPDVDECATGTDDCDDPNAVCNNTPGTFGCGCRAGFVGTGRVAGSCRWNDPSLSGLAVGAGATLSPALAPGTTTYTVTLPVGATSTTFTATLPQPTRATMTAASTPLASGASRAVSLVGYAPTLVSVVVTTETGVSRTYTVIVTRGAHYVKASNTDTADSFGGAIALSGDGNTMAVGAPAEASIATGIGGDQANDSAAGAGAVYVFRRAAGIWTQEAYVKASNTDPGDLFGRALSLSSDGSMLAVGAPAEDSNATGIGGDQTSDGETNAGAAYVFRRTGTSWAQEAYIKASNTEAGDAFAHAIALSGDGLTLAAGADGEAWGAGATYVFRRTSGAWAQEAYLKSSSGRAFGWSVALSGDGAVLAAGAPDDFTAANYAGSVTVYRRTVTWAFEAFLQAPMIRPSEQFGTAVALSADGIALAVGARYETVYVLRRSGATWAHEARITASNAAPGDEFGRSLALSSDGLRLAVGAPLEDSRAVGIGGEQNDEAAGGSGAVYLYRRVATTWSQEAYVKATNTNAADAFGTSVALAADSSALAVGATQEDSNATGIGGDQTNESASQSGATYVY